MKLLIIFSITSSFLLCTCSAKDNSQSVDRLISNICAIARERVRNRSGVNPEKHQKILNQLRKQIEKSAAKQGLQSSEHIQFILTGIHTLSFKEHYNKLCGNKINASGKSFKEKVENVFVQSGIDLHKKALRDANSSEYSNNEYDEGDNTAMTKTNATEEKMAEIKSLIDKMESIIMKTVKDDMMTADRIKVAKRLKHQFVKAIRRAYRNSEKLQTYISLVRQGMDIAIEKVLNNSLRRSEVQDPVAKEALAEVPQPEKLKGDLAKAPLLQQIKELEKVSHHERNITEYTPTSAPIISTTNFQGVTRVYGCNDILKDTCVNLKGLEKYTCAYDGTSLELSQICDGNVDCPDGSDEKDCIKQVIGKIHSATQVMAKVEMSQNCFKSMIDKSLLSKQGELLSTLLNSQVQFLNKYTQSGLHPSQSPHKPTEKDKQKKYLSNNSIHELALEVAVIVRSFASTLTNSLCGVDDKIQKDVDDLLGAKIDKEFEELQLESRTAWMPIDCKCNNQFCTNASTCSPRCKRYCYQRHSLQSFNCRSIKKGQNNVPLDYVCDGKLDCLDEADETNCPDATAHSKFEGSKLFNKVINLLKTKSMTREFASVRIELVELQSCIQTLQGRTVERELEIEMIKYSRNKCFSKLIDIFDIILEESNLMKAEQEAIYDFLYMVNENIIMAMKHTNVGNKKIISTEECFCRGTECGQVNCPPRCVRLCSVKTLLTNYNCSSSLNNTTFIPIDNICDGKPNCPNGEDELNCKKDICRTHHLKVIRRDIKTLCEKYHGTGIGDVLEKWRTKVTSNLVVLENRERLTPKVYKHAVSQMLTDLSLTFASLGQTNRPETDKLRVRKFAKLSQYMMEMLKECNT